MMSFSTERVVHETIFVVLKVLILVLTEVIFLY